MKTKAFMLGGDCTPASGTLSLLLSKAGVPHGFKDRGSSYNIITYLFSQRQDDGAEYDYWVQEAKKDPVMAWKFLKLFYGDKM